MSTNGVLGCDKLELVNYAAVLPYCVSLFALEITVTYI